jgi:hypothetical protein
VVDVEGTCDRPTTWNISGAQKAIAFWDQNMHGGTGIGVWNQGPGPIRDLSVSIGDTASADLQGTVLAVLFRAEPDKTLGSIDIAGPNGTFTWTPNEAPKSVTEFSGPAGQYRITSTIATTQPVYGILGGFQRADSLQAVTLSH